MDVEFTQRPETYLAKKRYAEPKEVFKQARALLNGPREPQAGALFRDMGCATGELTYYLKQEFPEARFDGVDYLPDFIDAAKGVPELEGCDFVVGDVLQYRGSPAAVTTCMGVLGAFDEFESLFESLIENTKEGGVIIVHSHFNDADIDVRSTYRDNMSDIGWNKGFNIYSKSRVSAWLDERVRGHSYHRVEFPFDLPPKPETPHRAYTLMLGDGRRVTTNGLCFMLPEHLLVIDR